MCRLFWVTIYLICAIRYEIPFLSYQKVWQIICSYCYASVHFSMPAHEVCIVNN